MLSSIDIIVVFQFWPINPSLIYPERVNRKNKLTTHNSGLNIEMIPKQFRNQEHCSCFPSSLLSFRLVLHLGGSLILLGLPSSQVFRKIQYTKYSVCLATAFYLMPCDQEKIQVSEHLFWLKIIIVCIQITLQSISFTLWFQLKFKSHQLFFSLQLSLGYQLYWERYNL